MCVHHYNQSGKVHYRLTNQMMKNQPDNNNDDDDVDVEPDTIKDADVVDDDGDDDVDGGSNGNSSSSNEYDASVGSNSFEIETPKTICSTPLNSISTIKTLISESNSAVNIVKNKRQQFIEQPIIINEEMFSTHQRILGRNLNGTSKSMEHFFF